MTQPIGALQPLGDFQPADVWQTHVNAIFYGLKGPQIHQHFQTYVSRDHRLAHALADGFLEGADRLPAEGPLHVLEWGIGNGNLAACFLSRLQTQDQAGRIYPRVRYLLGDYSRQILNGARHHPRLGEHSGRTSFFQFDAERSHPFKRGAIHKILSNEIWDDLATKVVLKHQGLFYEEYLQPALAPADSGDSPEPLARAFQDQDLDALAQHPELLEKIRWERSFQRVDLQGWPYAHVLQNHFDQIQDEIPTPVNLGAFKTLERARAHLADSHLGYTGFDYGMLDLAALNQEGRPYFRLYGGQYTNMVNFPLLEAVGQDLGFSAIQREPQHQFVAHHLGDAVLSAVDLVQAHPKITRLAPWDVDLLMIKTLHALNEGYRSPYRQTLDYPPVPGAPKKHRKELAQRVKNLSPTGVPDTVAYLTRQEVRSAFRPLLKLGYREKDLESCWQTPPPAVAFAHITFA